MKQLKLFLWITGIFLLQTVLLILFGGSGAVPDLLFSFAVAYALYERSLKSVIWVTLICSLISASVKADPFAAVVLIFTYSAAISYMSYDKTKRIPGVIRAFGGTALFTAAGECIIYALSVLSKTARGAEYFTSHVIPVTAVCAVCAGIIYAALTKCFDIKDSAKKLIIS